MAEPRRRNLENGKNTQRQKKNGTSKTQEQPTRTVTNWELLNMIFEILIVPILMIGFHLVCNEKQCSFTSLPDLSQYKSLSDFFNLESFLFFLAYVAVLVIFGCLPLGGEKIRVKNYTYNLNGFNSTLCLILTMLVCESFGVPVSYYISEHLLHLVVSVLIFQVSLAVFVYIFSFTAREDELNPAEIGTPFISAFYNGRQINPRLFNTVDIKFTYVKIYTSTLIITDISMVLKTLNLTTNTGLNLNNITWNSLSSNPTIVVLAIAHSAYFLCHLYYESRTLSYYFAHSEGMGYNLVMANSFRWSGLIAQTRYIIQHKIHYPNWQLACLLAIYLFGQYVYNVTNNQKDYLRRYPDSPESKRMKRIPTSQGKDILCDGWWGVVRQPNITSDILVHLTWLRFGFTAPPVLSIMSFFYYFIARAVVSQRDCKMKYGLAWQKYCRKVKYVLVPFVY
ncbi:delta(14)-sterol reductase LBR-like [Coccinella septempunctata]|uniref:delta(14)-sterol reductase LBR-like n=1 Tax=Coccinella septempunctata TaxID=41139 RepID=UPI001D09403B|nr:delta(14)-sterol reductase LBR-like [Coccinella septempunctata]